jgi:transposase-like protein
MVQKRKQHSDEFKAKVALEAVKGVRTSGQLSSVFGIHPTQIANWKRQLIDGAPRIFSSAYGNSGKTETELTAPLYEEIGRLKVEADWLKKKL